MGVFGGYIALVQPVIVRIRGLAQYITLNIAVQGSLSFSGPTRYMYAFAHVYKAFL